MRGHDHALPLETSPASCRRTSYFSSLIWPEPNAAACVCDLADGRAWLVASRADEYRRRAQHCLEMAAAFRDRDARVALSPQAWLQLAERNDFIAPVATECAQPVVQQ